MYFNKDTQASIVEFQGLESEKDREKLYNEKIHPAFEKLAESLIFVYGFRAGSNQIENIKTDCVSFLYETIHKWDESRGTWVATEFTTTTRDGDKVPDPTGNTFSWNSTTSEWDAI